MATGKSVELNTTEDYIEWAIVKIEEHPVGSYTNPIRRLKMAMELARLAVDLHVALRQSLWEEYKGFYG